MHCTSEEDREETCRLDSHHIPTYTDMETLSASIGDKKP